MYPTAIQKPVKSSALSSGLSMSEPKKKPPEKQENGIPQLPFNEALKRVWASKPLHKTAKNTAEKK